MEVPGRSSTARGLLKRLGLTGPGPASRFSDEDLDAFDTRDRAFGLVRLGTLPVPLARLRDTILDTPGLTPPRSCHLGNLSGIVSGRAGLMDYERAVNAVGLNRFYLFDLNQTENDDLTLGDTLYRPGTLLDQDPPVPLDLHHWSEAGFAPCDRRQSYFAPFIVARRDGSLTPLAALNRERLDGLPGKFGFQSRFLQRHAATVKAHIRALVEDALTRENPARALENVVDRWVSLSGSVRRDRFRIERGTLFLGGERYGSPAEVAEAAMWPIRAAADPSWFLSSVTHLPAAMPLISNSFLLLEAAMLNAHWGGPPEDRDDRCSPATPHVHWGGLGMVGTPPWRSGYVRKNMKRMRRLATVLIRDFHDLDPVLFLLAPTPAWAIATNDTHPDDASAVQSLIEAVLADQTTASDDRASAAAAVQLRVAAWLRHGGSRTSDYFRRKFSTRRVVWIPGLNVEETRPIYPPSFWHLSTAQALMTVGALLDQSGLPR